MSRSIKWLFLLGFCYLILLQIIAIWPFTIDDMFISLRYAKNWVEGHGLVWNVGQAPIEGYSNFSFVFLAAIALRLGLDPVLLLKGIGVLSLFLSSLAVFLLTRMWFVRWFALVPCIWMLLYRAELIWTVSGLETISYQALLCFSLYFLLRGMGYGLYPVQRKDPQSLYFLIAGLLLALAGLTRPEAPAIMLLFAGLALWDSPKGKKKKYYQGLLLGCLSCILIFAPYFMWRWNYFGRLFPNPVYCKNFGYFGVMDQKYLLFAWPFFLFALVAIVKAKDKRHYFFWLPNLLYLLLLIDADPVSAFENRLFLPVFALLLPLAFSGLGHCCDFIVKNKDHYRISALLSSLWIAFLFIPALTPGGYSYFSLNPQAGIALRQKIVNWLEQNAERNSQVVLADAGLIPYYSSLNFIDSYCLNNKAMTKPPRKKMYQRLCEDVFVSKPEVIILTSYNEKEKLIYTPADLCLDKKLQESKLYEFRTRFSSSSKNNSYRYEIYTLLR